jgi:Fic family protein
MRTEITVTKQQVKQMVLDNMYTIRGFSNSRMRGFRVADVSFFLEAATATITVAVNELVNEGVLRVVRKAGRVNVYGAC